MRLLNKSLTESVYNALNEGERYVIKYWESEADRDEGFSETEYITADDLEDAIAQTREMYYDNDWASCELGDEDDEEVSGPLFGIYPEDKKVTEERFGRAKVNESVTVTAGSTYVTVDETGVMVDDNGTTVTVNGGATVNIENNELVPEVPMGDMGAEAPLEPVEGEVPVENEEPTEEVPAEDGEEVIEPSEELLEPEEEDELKENAGDPNSTVEIYKNPEFDYSIKDITELDNVDVGDVRSIDMFSILNGLEERLQERYGTENWGLLNTFQTRQGKHKKTNESYASAILDISIPKNKRLQELNTVLTVEVYGDKALKECVVKDARYNKRIERFCGKTKDPVKFLEGVMVDLVNNRAKLKLTNYQPMKEDVDHSNEGIADEAYDIAEIINNNADSRAQTNDKGDKILRRDDFDEEFALACKEVLGLSDDDMDNFWSGDLLKNRFKDHPYSGCEDPWDLEVTVRSILGYDGWDTIYEDDDENDYCEGDLVSRNWDNEESMNEDVEFMVGKPYEDKGMNFADGKAIDKDVKRQERHIKQHKSLGKSTKKFKVEKEPDQKNTQGKKVEDLADTVEPSKEGGKKKKSPSKKKKSVKESLEGNNAFWEKGVKSGAKFPSDAGEIEILDLDKNSNYILGKRRSKWSKDGKDDYVSYVAAWNPELVGDKITWGQGHYFDSQDSDNEKNARDYFEKKKLGEGVNEDADRIVLKPVENFDFTDPYGDYYSDDNGNLYKSVDNGNELYICTKAGEPLKDVNPENYILGDKALNENTESLRAEIQPIIDKAKELGWNVDETGSELEFELSGDSGFVIGQMYLDLDDYKSVKEVLRSLKSQAEDDSPYGYDENWNLYSEIKDLFNKKPIKEAKGLLDDEDTPTESDVDENSEDLVDIDDSELEEGATEVAIFHRRPASVDAMKKAEANGITVNKSNYKIIGTKELPKEQFEDFAKHLSSGSYSWLKDMYKADDSNSGTFNCIEVKNMDDSSMTLLVDPNGYDYARYVAMKPENVEENPEDIEEEPIEEPEVAE